MSPLLALVYLERMAKNGVFSYDNELAIEAAIKALKKLVPKKPREVKDHAYFGTNCYDHSTGRRWTEVVKNEN